ncbi:MAG: FtsX-like permease family protein, partial [Anaerolineae bacterium]
MRSLNTLIWRNLTAHPLRSILTALAISLGVAMVLAASIVGQAASQSASALSEKGPQIDLEVFSRDGTPFDDAVLDTLYASPDVDLVSPLLRVEVEGVDPEISSLTLLGVDPESYAALHEPELAGGAFLDRPDTIVLPVDTALRHSLNVGDEVALLAPSVAEGRAGDRVVVLTIAGRLTVGQDAILPYGGQSPPAFVPLKVAQTLADAPGQVDRVEVALRPGADVEQARANLAQALGPDLAVVRAVVAGGAMGNVILMQAGLAIVGLIILFAASFVILNAFAMSVTARTREIGALRALGMTRRQVLSTVLAEAGLLGLAGTIAGVLVGLGLAWAVMRTFGNLEDAPFAVPWWGLSLSALLGLAVTLIAALQPAWRASRVSPIVAVRSEGQETRFLGKTWFLWSGRVGAVLLGLLLPGLAAYGLLVRPDAFTALPVLVVGQAALLGATVLLLPALVDPVTALCRPLLVRGLGTAGRLAADNLGRNKMRTVLTAGALTAGLTLIVASSGLMTAGLKGAISSMRSTTANEDVLITADLAEMVASQELTFDNFFEFLTRDDLGFDLNPVVEALNPLVESGRIEVIRYRFQVTPPDLAAVPGAPGLFVDPELYLRINNFDFFEGDPETALEWMQRGRAVLLMPIVAERLGVQVGDDIPVQTPHGEVEFTVAGIGGGGWLMTILPYADGEAYFNVTKPSFLGVVVADGQDVDTVLERVEKAIEPFPQIMLLDYDESLDPVLEVVDRLALLLDGLLLLAVVVAALGVVNTMVINVAERGREIGLLRAVGATQRQVRQAVVAEAATLGLLAALVADGLGLLMLLTYGLLILPGGTASLGVHADWETIRLTMGGGLRDWAIAAAVSLVFGPLVAALAAYYPARQAAAMDVVEATRSERVTLKRTGARRPEGRRRMTRSLTWTMAWRNLEQGRTRTILSALAVALGVAMIIAADVIASAIFSAHQKSATGQNVEFFAEMFDFGLTIVGVAILVAAGFLIFNAFAMAITQRKRQIGALRALGMTRRQVMRLVLVEALLIGGIGTLLGLVAGPLLGGGLIA